jgi:hypothetical protein
MTTTKDPNSTPSDDEIKKLWSKAVRLSRPWRSSLARRWADAIADDLEERGVTDADIDRIEADAA